MTSDKFHENDTFDEWSRKQYADSLEFKSVSEVHKIYPNWNLDEIRQHIPMFLSRHAKLVKNTNNAHPELSIGDIETFISDYVEICQRNKNIYIELFGSPPINMNHLSKWNSTIARVSKIIYEHPGGGHIDSPKYKVKDEFGHSSTYGFRINKKVHSIKADEQLGRDISKIRDDNKHRFETESDFLRELIFKGVSIYALINQDTVTSGKEILLSMERKMAEDKELSRIQRRDDINSYLNSRLEYLEKTILEIEDKEDRTELLKIFRNETDEFLKENLAYFTGDMGMKILVKHTIMSNRDLERMLRKLEDNGLVTKEYMESIIKNGTVIMPSDTVIPYTNLVEENDVR
jgi:hypothetical protein